MLFIEYGFSFRHYNGVVLFSFDVHGFFAHMDVFVGGSGVCGDSGLKTHEIGVIDSCESLYGCWESNLGSL